MKYAVWMVLWGTFSLGGTPVAAAADCADLKALPGRYELSHPREARDRQAEAVEQVVEQMSWLFRRVARSRLVEGNPLAEVVEVRCEGRAVHVWFDDRRFSAPIDGRPVWVTGSDEDPVRLSARLRDGRLSLHFEGDGGGKEVGLWLEGADRMVVDTRVHSPRLPSDVEYEASYEAAR